MGTGLFQLGYAVLGGLAARALDEPAAAVVAACPRSRVRGVALRALSFGPWLGLAATLSIGHVRQHRFLLVELVGCAIVGFTAAAVARRWMDEPGDVVGPAVALTFVAALVVAPIAHELALFPDGAAGTRTLLSWAAIALVSAATLAVVVPERRWRR
jgi:hypothetical protein